MASTDRKVCPQCGAIRKLDATRCRSLLAGCGYEFTGGEPGASPWVVTVDTELRVLPHSAIAARLGALPEEPAVSAAAHEKDVSTFRHRLLARALPAWLVALVIAGVAYAVWKGAITGVSPALVIIGALLAVGVGLFLTLKYMWWYGRGPRLATPEDVVKTFYSELGIAGAMGSAGRAWVCLDTAAQAQFKDVDDFEAYWERGRSAPAAYARGKVERSSGYGRPKRRTRLKCSAT